MRSALALATALLAFAGCAGAETPAPGPRGLREAPAEIVRASVRSAESQPPQLFADVVVALPNGCTHYARSEASRQGDDVVSVRVFVTLPADPAAMCTMIYGEREVAVPLGSDFRRGASYTLDVNGTRQRFVAP